MVLCTSQPYPDHFTNLHWKTTSLLDHPICIGNNKHSRSLDWYRLRGTYLTLGTVHISLTLVRKKVPQVLIIELCTKATRWTSTSGIYYLPTTIYYSQFPQTEHPPNRDDADMVGDEDVNSIPFYFISIPSCDSIPIWSLFGRCDEVMKAWSRLLRQWKSTFFFL